MFKVKIRCVSDIIKEIFEIENRKYNFHDYVLIKRFNIRSVYYGPEIFYWPKNMGHFT